MRVPLAFLLAASVTLSLAGAQQSAPPNAPPASDDPGGKVILSRSLDDANATTPTPPEQAATRSIPGGSVTDAERRGFTFVSYDLDVRLRPRQQGIAVRVHMTLRNDGDSPLHRLPLQLSSSLNWLSVRVAGEAAPFVQHQVSSDTDHTSALNEAVVALPHAIEATQSVDVDATYEGSIPLSAQRLMQIGTPTEQAEHSDWDRVSDDFIGLRGFGNVVWYPVVSAPVALGDQDKFFTEIASTRLRQSHATVAMQVSEEFFGAAPNLAILDGKLSPITTASLPMTANLPGIATCTLPKTRLGFSTPSLFLLTRVESSSPGLRFFTRTEDTANVQPYQAAAELVLPLLQRWLSPKPKRELIIVDLPEPQDASFEEGAVLFTGVQPALPEELAGVLVHSLSHAYFDSPYPWLQEGAAYFMGTLWVAQRHGRDAAVAQLDNSRGALALAEPADPAPEPAGSKPNIQQAVDSATGESLIAARDAIYYRTKATYVFWMLRDLASDEALGEAFRQYDPSADVDGSQFQRLIEQDAKKDLMWFFADWVYHDRGLPDLSIAGVYPSSANVPGSYIVAVDIANTGYADAEVPVSVRSGATTITSRLRIPANSRLTHRFLLAGQPEEVSVNDGTVPEVQASVHRWTVADGH